MLNDETEETIRKTFDAWCWLNRHRINIEDYSYVSGDDFRKTKNNIYLETAKKQFNLDDRALCVYKNILLKEFGDFNITKEEIEEKFNLSCNTCYDFYILIDTEGFYTSGRFQTKEELLESIVEMLVYVRSEFKIFQIIDNDTVKELEWDITATLSN